MTLKETFRLIRADLLRRLALEGRKPNVINLFELFLHRGVLLVVIYRLTKYLRFRGFGILARAGRFVQTLLCKSEIHINAEIGPGLVASDMGGIGIPNFAIIGENCTFLSQSLLTLGGMDNVDLQNDRIVIGNNCVIGQGARVMGAIELGDGTQVKSNSVVITSFKKPGQIVSGIPARRRGVVPLEKIRAWSPLSGQFISTFTVPSCDDSRSSEPSV
jgi:serine O-acetyltransferase